MINRKLIAFFGLFLVGLTSLEAQTGELTVNPKRVDKEVAVNVLDVDYEEITTITLTNNESRELQLQWEKEAVDQPEEWETLVCNRTPNYAPFQNGANTELTEDKRPFRLAPGESLDFYLILRPNGKTGKGRTRLSFVDLNQPGKVLETATFDLNVTRRAVAEAEQPANVPKVTRIYPNPAIENFFVEVPSNKRLGRVEVVNTLGRKIKTFDRPAGPDGYDIEDLPEGIYLINIYDALGNKLKTLRLFHRNFGA